MSTLMAPSSRTSSAPSSTARAPVSSTRGSAALAVLHRRIEAQALLQSFNQNFMVLALAFLAASGLVVFMRRPVQQGVVDTNAH